MPMMSSSEQMNKMTDEQCYSRVNMMSREDEQCYSRVNMMSREDEQL